MEVKVKSNSTNKTRNSKSRSKQRSKQSIAKKKKDLLVYGLSVLIALIILFVLFFMIDKATGAETRFF